MIMRDARTGGITHIITDVEAAWLIGIRQRLKTETLEFMKLLNLFLIQLPYINDMPIWKD